jgi:hypothetical protein
MMFPSPAPEHLAKPLKCLAFRGLGFFGAEKVSKKCRMHTVTHQHHSQDEREALFNLVCKIRNEVIIVSSS